MVLPGYLASVVDIAFVAFVSYTCWRSMGSSSDDAGALVAERWRNELRELERSLRGLIEEASVSSTSLDRRLIRRREELEALLRRAEGMTNSVSDNAGVRQNRHATDLADRQKATDSAERSQSRTPERVSPPITSRSSLSRAYTSQADRPSESWFNEGEEDELSNLDGPMVEDSVSLTRRGTPTAADRRTTKIATANSAAAKSAVEKPPISAANGSEPLTVAEQETFSKLSMTDPIAYRIARRLLSQGIEIHVVARKLDLPVSEIRMLDRLMLDESEASERRPAVYRRVEPIPERKIVRSQNATAQGSRQQRSSLELDVELTERYDDRLEQATKQINRLGSNIERRSALL